MFYMQMLFIKIIHLLLLIITFFVENNLRRLQWGDLRFDDHQGGQTLVYVLAPLWPFRETFGVFGEKMPYEVMFNNFLFRSYRVIIKVVREPSGTFW